MECECECERDGDSCVKLTIKLIMMANDYVNRTRTWQDRLQRAKNSMGVN